MVKDSQRPPQSYRNAAPCKGCTERFQACADRCARYKAWKTENDEINNKRTDYKNRRRRVWK